MLILMRTFSTDEYGNGGFDFGAVDLDDKKARTLMAYVKQFEVLKAENPLLTEITFRDDEVQCSFFPDDALRSEELLEKLDEESWLELEDQDRSKLKIKDVQDPEATFLIVTADGAYWHTEPRDVGFTIDTHVIDLSILRKIL